MRGMELRREDWAPLLEDEDHGASLVPILALAYEHCGTVMRGAGSRAGRSKIYRIGLPPVTAMVAPET
jgi:hypothetical protein